MTFARDLRNNATPEERALWHVLSRLRPRFTRQLQVGPFVADFACRRARVIVELDGSQHVECEADRRRTALLGERGWRVVRFWNRDVRDNLDGVVEAVSWAVVERLPEGESPTFVESRAGRERQLRIAVLSPEEPPSAPPRRRGGEQVSSANG